MLKLMPQSAIKAVIFPHVKVKKKIAEIVPKSRTTLLQGTENDVNIPTPEAAASESTVNNADPKAVAVKQQDINKDEIRIDKNMNGVFPVSSEKSFKNMSKLRTTLFQGEEDDEPMAPHNVTLNNVLLNKGKDSIIWGSNNINNSMTIKLGEFNIHMKHGERAKETSQAVSSSVLPCNLLFKGINLRKNIEKKRGYFYIGSIQVRLKEGTQIPWKRILIGSNCKASTKQAELE